MNCPICAHRAKLLIPATRTWVCTNVACQEPPFEAPLPEEPTLLSFPPPKETFRCKSQE